MAQQIVAQQIAAAFRLTRPASGPRRFVVGASSFGRNGKIKRHHLVQHQLQTPLATQHHGTQPAGETLYLRYEFRACISGESQCPPGAVSKRSIP